MTALRIVLLAVALANFGYLLTAAPASNAAMRVEGPLGDWRVADGSAHYRGPTYLRDQSLQHLIAASRDGDEQRTLAARQTALDSLRMSPANPFGWSLLGWSEALLENDAEAQAALLRSWNTAPKSGALALDRLLLAEALGLTGPNVTAEIAEHIEQDLRQAKRSDPRRLAIALERAAGLQAFAERLAETASKAGS